MVLRCNHFWKSCSLCWRFIYLYVFKLGARVFPFQQPYFDPIRSKCNSNSKCICTTYTYNICCVYFLYTHTYLYIPNFCCYWFRIRIRLVSHMCLLGRSEFIYFNQSILGLFASYIFIGVFIATRNVCVCVLVFARTVRLSVVWMIFLIIHPFECLVKTGLVGSLCCIGLIINY